MCTITGIIATIITIAAKLDARPVSRMKAICASLVGMVLAAIPAWGADPVATPVPLDKVPAVVWKTLQSSTAGITPTKVERLEDDGEVSYGATFNSPNGGERSVLVAADGKLISLEVMLADVPAAVKTTIARQLGAGHLSGINKQSDADEICYDVDFANAAGAARSFSVGADGTLLSLQLSLAEAPEEVQKAVKNRIAGGGSLIRIDQVFDAGAVSFDVDYQKKQGKEISCTLAPDGKLASVDVPIDEAAVPVQATIRNKIGTGSMVRLSKVFGPKHNLLRYEVEAVVDGKAFDFSVAPKGKFLGMDS
ncbi:MAG: hypothetical protein JWO94_2649 [Verrucomicrobiaceae bacterium]|nr:hypothetical protein [Verrucomicrobiaceae bacterium]